jgi:threonine dehydratase
MSLPTPLEPAPAALAAYADVDDLRLKREDLHELGMFKWRAALPVVRELAGEGHGTIVTSSTGNHGAAVAWACREHGSRAIVFVPPGSTKSKLALLRSLGADVRVEGEDFDDAKHHAHVWARSEGLPFFEDGAEPLQYEAYSAIGSEILDQLDVPPAAVVTPIGNGALAGGIGAAVARSRGTTRVGVVPKDMPVMAESFEAGRAVDAGAGSTIADGMAVRVAIPLAVSRLRDAVDLMLRVSEREIAAALVACHDAGVEVEPSAAAAVAAARTLDASGPVVLVLTGRNLDPEILARARRDLESFPN